MVGAVLALTNGVLGNRILRFFFFLLGILVSFLTAGAAQACDLCSVYNATTASGVIGRGLQLGVAEQWTHHATLKNDGITVANTLHQRMDSSVTQWFVGYQFNKFWAVQGTVPILYRNFQRANGTVAETGSVFGIGDMSVLGKFTPYKKLTEDFTFVPQLLAGIKFPTGSSSRLGEEANETPPALGDIESGVHGHDLTLGSGSFDGIVGMNFYLRWFRFLSTADVQYMIHTKGAAQYRFANDLNWKEGLGVYLWLTHPYTVALQCQVSGEYKGKDSSAGAEAADTGLASVYMGPQLLLTWQEHLSAQLGGDFPVVMRNTSVQITPSYRMHAGVSWHF